MSRGEDPPYAQPTTVRLAAPIPGAGYQVLPPGLAEAEPGVVRTRVNWIVVKRAASWEILAQQMTALAPGTSF